MFISRWTVPLRLSFWLDHLKLKLELVKYGGLSKSLRFRQLLTSFMVGKVTLVLSMTPLRRDPSLVPLHKVTRRLYSSRLKGKDARHCVMLHAGMNLDQCEQQELLSLVVSALLRESLMFYLIPLSKYWCIEKIVL